MLKHVKGITLILPADNLEQEGRFQVREGGRFLLDINNDVWERFFSDGEKCHYTRIDMETVDA